MRRRKGRPRKDPDAPPGSLTVHVWQQIEREDVPSLVELGWRSGANSNGLSISLHRA